MHSEAGDFRIRGGFVVPIRWADGRVHAVSSMGTNIEARDPNLRIIVRTVCTSLLDRLEAADDAPFIEHDMPQLPPRATRYLQLTASGMSSEDISRKYKRPAPDVTATIANACLALGVSDEQHAVMRASRYRLLSL